MNAKKAQPERCTTSSSAMLFVDGELEPSQLVELEAHLTRCAGCREEVELARAVRQSLRRSTSRRAPEGLEARMRGAMGAAAEPARLPEDRWSGAREAATPSVARKRTRKVATTVAWLAAGAACFAGGVAFFSSAERAPAARAAHLPPREAPSIQREPSAAVPAVAHSFDSIIDQLVALHADPLPPETTNPDELVRLETYVGVPVKSTAMRLMQGASPERPRFAGARILPVREQQRAAAVQYTMKGHRLTMYVFDSRGLPMRITRLEQRQVRQGPVYVGKLRGYSIAAAERSGVGYALASDLDLENNAQMVASF